MVNGELGRPIHRSSFDAAFIVMLLAVDIGNSSIKFGLFDGGILSTRFSIPTRKNNSTEKMTLAVDGRLGLPVEQALVCSVVPDIDAAMREFLLRSTDREPVFVRNTDDLGLKVNYQPLDSLGTDRLIAAFAAVEMYDAPCIVCSLGTATTIDVVSAAREFVGGVIAPGLDAMSEALHVAAPRLPRQDVSRPDELLGTSTTASIRSGVYHGYVSMVEGLIKRIKIDTGVSKVIGTGGNVLLMPATGSDGMTIAEDLVLKGLDLLSRRNG